MGHYIVKILMLAAVLFVCMQTMADDNEFGTWLSAGAEKKLNKKWSIETEAEFRVQDNMKKVDRWSGSLGVEYKAFKFLKFGMAYEFLYNYNMEDCNDHYNSSNVQNGYNITHAYWMPKHRVSLDVTGNKNLGNFSFSLRERVQYTHNDSTTVTRDKYRGLNDGNLYLDDTDIKTIESKNKWVLRSRLQAEYNISHSRFTPYTYMELFNSMNSGMALDKVRLSIGSQYKINRQNSLKVGYIFNSSNDEDEPKGNILGISYTFKF